MILKSKKTQCSNKIELIGDLSAKVLVVGVVHGDEPQGKFLIEEYLKKNPFDNLLFIPCLNPDGLAKSTRTNSNGVDLNRNFPTKNWGKNLGINASCDDNTTQYYGGKFPASEIETQFLINVVEEYKPELILTLHAPYKVVNFDGPAREISEKISDIINYPVEESIGYPTPGSLGTYAGVERHIPVVTLELDDLCKTEELIEPVFKIFDLLKVFCCKI